MNEQTQAKLDRLQMLLAERTRIDGEIEELLAGTRIAAEHHSDQRQKPHHEKPAAKTKGVGRQHKCSFCGKPGHSVRTCPQARGAHPEDSSQDSLTKSVPLTMSQYIELRNAMHDRDFQSAKYALVNRLSPKEVNRAVVSRDYDDYATGPF